MMQGGTGERRRGLKVARVLNTQMLDRSRYAKTDSGLQLRARCKRERVQGGKKVHLPCLHRGASRHT